MKLKRIALGYMTLMLALNGQLNSGQYEASSINPILAWNTFLGGGGGIARGKGIAVDASGSIYITGYSTSTWGNPVRPFSAGDAFVAKLDSKGVLLWNTFLGGNSGDEGMSIAVDGSGNVYLAGTSCGSWGSPIRSFSGYSDAFAAKLDANGVLQWNTFLGGDIGDVTSPIDKGEGIALDSSGNVCVTGCSVAAWENPIRAFSGSTDAFVAKLDANGILRWNTFLGSESSSDWENGESIAVDGSDNVRVTGSSHASWGNPIRPYSSSYASAFAAKLDSSGALLWNTFLGGDNGSTWGGGISVDRSENVYVAGSSSTTWGNPIHAFYGAPEAFVAKLDANGSLQWNTFHWKADPDHPERRIGGQDGTAIAVDGSGYIYMAGTYSWGALSSGYDLISEGSEAVAIKLDSGGAFLWDAFLGRDEDFVYNEANGIAFDGSGNACLTGWSDLSWGDPVRHFAGSHANAFAAKIGSPSMAVTAPAGGEAWVIGATQGLTWVSSGVGGNVSINLIKGTSNLGAIATGIPAAAGVYNWRSGYLKDGKKVPGGNDYRISVVSAARRSVKATSQGRFTLIKPRISVKSPVNGATWKINSPQRIAWTSTGVSGTVNIFLYRNGVLKGQIALAVPVTDLGYSWTVGALNDGTVVPAGTGYSIYVRTADAGVSGRSGGTFTIKR